MNHWVFREQLPIRLDVFPHSECGKIENSQVRFFFNADRRKLALT